MENSINFIQELLSCMHDLHLVEVEDTPEALQTHIDKSTHGIFSSLLKSGNLYKKPTLPASDRAEVVYECIFFGGITYFVHNNAKNKKYYFIGPMLTKSVSDSNLRLEAERYNVPERVIDMIADFCTDLPVVPSHAAYRMADLVFGHLSGATSPLKIVQYNTLSVIREQFSENLQLPEKEILEMRRTERRYEYSITLTEAVKEGNLSLALSLMGRHTPSSENQVRNPNPLRNAQNYCIVLNTQLRHALEGSGIHPSRIDALSSDIGVQIERLSSLNQIPELMNRMLRQYCRLVQEYKFPGLRPLTHLAVCYVKDHLAENITVKETANALAVNANYLSTVFHNDIGCTFIDFVNKERIDQAATLLKNTSLQIQQIATMVGYNNTSYFAKQFRRLYGRTPQQYRSRK